MAIRMGEDNQKGAEKILANCFVMTVAFSAASHRACDRI